MKLKAMNYIAGIVCSFVLYCAAVQLYASYQLSEASHNAGLAAMCLRSNDFEGADKYIEKAVTHRQAANRILLFLPKFLR